MDDWVDASGDSAVSMLLGNDSKVTSEEVSKKSDHSSDIASKLLQGWTLLGQCCPVCITPLVRNRQKQMYCVSCSQWVLTEEQLAEKLQAQHVKDAEATTIDSSAPSTDQPSMPTATSNGMQFHQTGPLSGKGDRGSRVRIASLRDAAENIDERSPKRLASIELLNSGTETSFRNQAATTTVPHAGATEKSTQNQTHNINHLITFIEGGLAHQVTLPSNSSAVLSRTSSTLFQKLEELQCAVAACTNFDKLNQLLVTTKECLDAIKKVQDLIAAHCNEDDCAQVDQIYLF